MARAVWPLRLMITTPSPPSTFSARSGDVMVSPPWRLSWTTKNLPSA
jgi:hypothetical protein